MNQRFKAVFAVAAALMFCGSAHALTLDNVEVVQIGTYHHVAAHFVWFTAAPPAAQCATPLSFDESQQGGKSLMAVLITALVNKRKIDVRYEGCDITEIYLR
jgi:hypothetical protein